MSKPVLVFILSKQCGACVAFKRKMLHQLETDLAATPSKFAGGFKFTPIKG